MTHAPATWLVLTRLRTRHDSLTYIYIYIYVYIYVWTSTVSIDILGDNPREIVPTWLNRMCDMSYPRATWLILTHLYMWHDSLAQVTIRGRLCRHITGILLHKSLSFTGFCFHSYISFDISLERDCADILQVSSPITASHLRVFPSTHTAYF